MIRQDFLDSVECLEDVVYKTVKGHEMKLDLYRPKGGPRERTPLLILLHGGGWFRQDKKHEPPFQMGDIDIIHYIIRTCIICP